MTDGTFQRSAVLEAPVEEVFAFHNDPRNLLQISPRWQRVTIVRAEASARPGAEFEFHVRLFGLLNLRWVGIWRDVEPPGLLVDEAIAGGPFAYWRHRHEFRALDAGRTEMIDRVTYRFAGGRAGRWFGQTLGRLGLSLMFSDRHARTARWLREHAAK